jgi:exodeoxyribonuclease VII small subunit
MTDERTGFEQTRSRLDEILVAVRKKDTSLEQSLELLEEGVRLANMCNEQIDQTSWRSPDTADEHDQPESDEMESADGRDSAVEGAEGEVPGSAASRGDPEGVSDDESESDDTAPRADEVPDDDRS